MRQIYNLVRSSLLRTATESMVCKYVLWFVMACVPVAAPFGSF